MPVTPVPTARPRPHFSPGTHERGPGVAPASSLHPAAWGSAPATLPARTLAVMAAGLASAMTTASFEALPSVSPSDRGRRRYARLLETASYDAWLIAWPPTCRLELHDHGGSIGAVHIVMGELIETYTDLIGRQPLRSRDVASGGALAVRASRVHEIWNPGPDDALSVHVYSPPLVAMTFYDDHPDRFLTPLPTVHGAVAELER
jgi:predicted metal-dependent enzyme (double-stranded beta helix superfamily)